MDMSGATWFLAIAVSLILGLTLVFFYAVARPRFGPGPMTALKVALGLYIGGYPLSLIGYHMGGIYPDALLVKFAWMGLISTVLATLIGGWIYKEE